MAGKHWQHEDPIKCPDGHQMLWLGAAFWICEKCREVYVQIVEVADAR